jgi:hypothetical protein
MMTKHIKFKINCKKNYSDSALTGLIILMCIQTIAQTSKTTILTSQSEIKKRDCLLQRSD